MIRSNVNSEQASMGVTAAGAAEEIGTSGEEMDDATIARYSNPNLRRLTKPICLYATINPPLLQGQAASRVRI
jgi:hypothetical protein